MVVRRKWTCVPSQPDPPISSAEPDELGTRVKSDLPENGQRVLHRKLLEIDRPVISRSDLEWSE